MALERARQPCGDPESTAPLFVGNFDLAARNGRVDVVFTEEGLRLQTALVRAPLKRIRAVRH